MDDLDSKILHLLRQNARMTVKDIAAQIALTSPAVSERIRKLERSGVIAGYTAVLRMPGDEKSVDALVSISLPQQQKESMLALMDTEPCVQRCYHVTGSYSLIAQVHCPAMADLEHLINKLQKIGQTSTQIILSTPVEHIARLAIE